MSRLTEINEWGDGRLLFAVDPCEAINKLAHYEDLEEQGRLIEQEQGRWGECDWVFYDGHGECIHIPKGAFVCTNCRRAFKKQFLQIKNYCPHCGAKMDEVENDER